MAEIFSGKVRDISSQGLGVVDHPDGRVFFVRGAWPGDEGDFEVESLEKRYGFAKTVDLSKYSEARIDNPCGHSGFAAGQCGGCPWLGIRYSDQLQQKQKMVDYLLKRTGSFEEGFTEVLPILPSPVELGYRNRAQFKTDGKNIGFVSPGTKTMAPINDCLVLTEKNRVTFRALKDMLPREGWKPEPPYLWSFIEIDEDVSVDEVQINKRRTFKQANDLQNANMRKWLRENLDGEEKNQTVLELFAGSGNFTEILSEHGFAKIIAAEVDQKAVDELNALKLSNVRGFASDLFYPKGWKALTAEGRDATLLVLDPPRDGFRSIDEFVDKFTKLRKIFYISCEANRFASEVRALKSAGWVLKSVQPVDQFPQTAHVEILAEIVKK